MVFKSILCGKFFSNQHLVKLVKSPEGIGFRGGIPHCCSIYLNQERMLFVRCLLYEKIGFNFLEEGERSRNSYPL